MRNGNPIDLRQLRLIVEGSPGMTKKEMIVRLNTDRNRMVRAQRKAISLQWLFVQTQGSGKDRILRYFTMQYAAENKLEQKLKALKKPRNRSLSGGNHSPYTQNIMDHCKLIDSLWLVRGLPQ